MKTAFIKAKPNGKKLQLDRLLHEIAIVGEEPSNELRHILKIREDADENVFEVEALQTCASRLYVAAIEGGEPLGDEGFFLDLVNFYRLTIGWFYEVSPDKNPLGELLCLGLARQKLANAVDHDFFYGTYPSSGVLWASQAFPDGDSDNLSLAEIGLLACMTEKSVRNLTHSTLSGPDRLQTIKEGASTKVEPFEALRWLRMRRGYVACQWEKAS